MQAKYSIIFLPMDFVRPKVNFTGTTKQNRSVSSFPLAEYLPWTNLIYN